MYVSSCTHSHGCAGLNAWIRGQSQLMGTACRRYHVSVLHLLRGCSPLLCFQNDQSVVEGAPAHMLCGDCLPARRNIIFLNSTCLPPLDVCLHINTSHREQARTQLVKIRLLWWLWYHALESHTPTLWGRLRWLHLWLDVQCDDWNWDFFYEAVPGVSRPDDKVWLPQPVISQVIVCAT